jgi:hypothetical protein
LTWEAIFFAAQKRFFSFFAPSSVKIGRSKEKIVLAQATQRQK